MNALPRISAVKLRKGTRFNIVLPDGTLSAERVLDHDEFVQVGDLGKTFNVYEDATGNTLMVLVENEVR